MHISQALEKWHDFYTLVGTAGATLVALLFVAISLGAGFLTQERARMTRIFISPVVVHFGAVFFVAAISLIPEHKRLFFATLIGATGVAGICVSIYTVTRLIKLWDDVMDHLAYGLIPGAGYVTLIVAAVFIAVDSEWALDTLAGGALTLLMVNIRNAWDLALSMVRRQSERANGNTSGSST
ncbi:MAG TPA: hypothetical protein VFB45_02450 [Pseudolabrys sp.]|nr:hypothetical protein [Pseudolabrys sp.]